MSRSSGLRPIVGTGHVDPEERAKMSAKMKFWAVVVGLALTPVLGVAAYQVASATSCPCGASCACGACACDAG